MKAPIINGRKAFVRHQRGASTRRRHQAEPEAEEPSHFCEVQDSLILILLNKVTFFYFRYKSCKLSQGAEYIRKWP